jgi:hypothetical protein
VRDSARRLRFLFVTLGHIESDFYGRCGRHLVEQGHDVAHVTFSRRAALVLRRQGFQATCLPDELSNIAGTLDVATEVRRITEMYPVPTFRDIYRTDFVCERQPEAESVARAVGHMVAMERIFDRFRPDIVIPEVGNETIRTAAHLVGLQRGIPILFLFYTIFPDPLRLNVNSMTAPIATRSDLRELTIDERAAVRRFVDEYTSRRGISREARESEVTLARFRILARHLFVKTIWDRDNDYLQPIRWVVQRLAERARSQAVRAVYEDGLPTGPFVYFPLHVADDYKVKRVLPHCADQAAILEQVADALPHGVKLVVKEHPMSIGRTPIAFLRRVRKQPNVHLVAPQTNSHDIIRQSSAVVVISSTVGLEALLYRKPVLTLGDPFYAGTGVTMDAESFAEIREKVPGVLKFKPDPELIERMLGAGIRRCLPGAPVLVDRSDANAERLSASLEQAARLACRSGNLPDQPPRESSTHSRRL